MNLASGWAPVFSIVMAAIANAGGSTLLKYSTSYRSAEGGKNAVFYLLFFGAMALFGGSFPFYAFGLSKMRLSAQFCSSGNPIQQRRSSVSSSSW